VPALSTVVIVGRPNVGKSTLFNRLLGRRKALVHDMPGVTRDRNLAIVHRDGCSFQLVDTGGLLGATEDPLISLVEDQVGIAIEGGDKVLFVVDGKEGLIPLERDLASRLRKLGKPVALVVNKVDAPGHEIRSAEFHALGLQPIFTVSAEHGGGMDPLWDFVLEGLPVEEETDEEEAPERGLEGPIKVAIVGRPNVGKSSLLNRLIGEERALVSDIPGTTRDPIDVPFRAAGKEFVVVDTAGIRRHVKTGPGAEILSVVLARRSIEQCHIALLVLDASQKPGHQDAHIAGLIEAARRGVVLVLNKWDLVKGETAAREAEEAVLEKFAFMDYLPIVRVSAHSGRGTDKVLPAAARAYRNYSQVLPTAALNKTLKLIVQRVSPPTLQGKELKLRYATQTGQAPPILTIFTNSKVPPPVNYSRYLKKEFRQIYDLLGSPLILKFRKE
jgi:GTPase